MKLLSFLSAFTCLFLLSCRQDADITAPVKYEGPIMVNFNNYEGAEGNVAYTKAEAIFKDSLQDVNVEVKLTNTTETAPTDIFVYLTKVDAIVSTYNTLNGGGLTSVSNADPALQYDFSKPVVIKKGTRRAQINMKVNPAKLNLGNQNAIGIGILRVEGGGAVVNNTNLSKLVIEFSAKNQYDGNYVANGYFYHPTAARTIDDRPKRAITAGPNSVIMELGDLGGSGYFALFTVNGTNVDITVAPGAAGGPYTPFTSGLPTTNPGYTPAWAGSSRCNNTYDPATKTFRVRYGYMGANGWRVTEEEIRMQ